MPIFDGNSLISRAMSRGCHGKSLLTGAINKREKQYSKQTFHEMFPGSLLSYGIVTSRKVDKRLKVTSFWLSSSSHIPPRNAHWVAGLSKWCSSCLTPSIHQNWNVFWNTIYGTRVLKITPYPVVKLCRICWVIHLWSRRARTNV